jgi:hypothetical protein
MRPSPDLAPLYRFFVLVGAEADASWLPFLPPALVARCQGSARGARLLSAWLRRRFAELAPPERWALDEAHRWLLAPRAVLAGHARALGARALAPRLRTCVDRARAYGVRAAFGPALYAAALRVEPIALHLMPWAEVDACATPAAFAALAERVGAALMLDTLPADAAHLRRRLQLRFPCAHAQPAAWRPVAEDLGPVRAVLAAG